MSSRWIFLLSNFILVLLTILSCSNHGYDLIICIQFFMRMTSRALHVWIHTMLELVFWIEMSTTEMLLSPCVYQWLHCSAVNDCYCLSITEFLTLVTGAAQAPDASCSASGASTHAILSKTVDLQTLQCELFISCVWCRFFGIFAVVDHDMQKLKHGFCMYITTVWNWLFQNNSTMCELVIWYRRQSFRQEWRN